MSETPAPKPARLKRKRFSFVWLVPLIAIGIAAYLGYRTLAQQGPLLTLQFDTAQGLVAGQTQVKYKAMTLGTLETIDLSRNNRHVIAHVRMNNVGARFLTSHARFWVVRPHFSFKDPSGLDTLVSGAFIGVDPGAPGGKPQSYFIGLEQPPGVRSDVAGRTFVLRAKDIGSLNTGSPVFYRDVQVGEVLGYDLGNGLGPAKIRIFVRAPFDNLVKPESLFWNSSGITAGIIGGAFHIEVQSIQALVTGGVTFALPPRADKDKPSPSEAVFPLYPTHEAAETAGYQTQLPVVSYFTSSVSGLTEGAPVMFLGIQVGVVSKLKLVVDLHSALIRAKVEMRLQPGRIFPNPQALQSINETTEFQKLVDRGMRVEIETGNIVTGQKIIAFTMVPHAKPASVTHEHHVMVLPSQPGGLDAIMQSLASVSAKLDKLPIQQIGDNMNKLIVTANRTLEHAPIDHTLNSVSQTAQSTNQLLKSLNRSYGPDSDFEINLERLISQSNQTLQSVQQLTNYLSQHPQAVLFGRSKH
ncbi:MULTISPECIES: PqiB family protein [Acidiphilium]|uniref:Paraquat-inducible protein B n=1 Tax=Acidiphilium rubrum TaxID=526 RepID=A0A8G2FLJ6_ACIRU|nr:MULTISPECIES: MlaD family protein [Acidiphilium]OYW03421.1 MAG: hypothetical protein B7Z58_03735 [Acidiphilium sp. 37-64-53]OZB30746.1 MAG: hypothetical protein B7X49_01785 [Acidiphilium sp. 34-64-41]SIR12187.1 paraquat-inducible protein B [Acidiphilium rubrum]HQT84587.1 MlaD family protein [Acidiphilium rubrum]